MERTVDPPRHVEANTANPFKQRNEPIWSDTIFGVDVVLTELVQYAEFTPNFARLFWPETKVVRFILQCGDDTCFSNELFNGSDRTFTGIASSLWKV